MNHTSHLHRAAVLALGLGSAFSLCAGTITNDLVVYLPFDNDYANLAQTPVAAAPVGAPTFTAGKFGTGAIVCSNDKGGAFFNYVTLGAPPELNFGGNVDFTVSFWVKFTTWTGDPSFISNKNWVDGGNVGWVLATGPDGRFQWNFTDGNARRDYDGPGGTLSDGHWHHVAISFARSGNAVTYLDGVLADSRPIAPSADTLDSGLPTNIGQDGTGGYTDSGNVGIADMTLDDMAVWRRALTGFEMGRIYQFGTNGQRLDQVTDPSGPALTGVLPTDGSINVTADTAISATILDGVLALDNSTVQLTLNSAVVTPAFSKVGALTTITYQPPSPLPNGSTNRVQLAFNSGATRVTTNWSFVVILTSQAPGITGQWDFDNGDLSARLGKPLTYRDGPAGSTAQQTKFGTTTSFGLPPINGAPAKVMGIPKAATRNIGYIMDHGARPNGDPHATKVNQWTIIMDILIPNANGEEWFSFMQIDNPINNSDDGDLFAHFSGGTAGIGIGGSYQGNLTAGQWHRVAFAVDMTGASPVISKWIDGAKASDQPRTPPQLDGRHALFPTISMFSDEDGESQPAFLNSIQIRNYKMSDASLIALGGPSAQGIPLVTGQWDFDGANLAATVGFDLIPLPATELFTGYNTPTINGALANAMSWSYTPADVTSAPLGYLMPHGALPNGGGQHVNQYTLIMDILFPANSTGFRGLFQTDTNDTSDADIFVDDSNGIGISGEYQGDLTPDTWHRLAFTFDLTRRELGKYLDGQNVLTGPVGSAPLGTGPFQYLSSGVDQRWSLDSLAVLFTDNDGEIGPGSVNSIQFRAEVLSAVQIATLGGPTAAGIPVNLPDQPTLKIEIGPFGPTISWPLSYTDYILESSFRLGPGAVWTTVDGVGANVFEEYRIADPAIFYRLRKMP